MPRIHPVEAEQTVGHSRTLLDGVGAKFGRTPNLMRTLAHSPAALRGYLDFSGALQRGLLPASLRGADRVGGRGNQRV